MGRAHLAATNEELQLANKEIMVASNDMEATNVHLIRINADLDYFNYTASHDLKPHW